MYSCKECCYETNRKDTYNRHLTSGKHLRKIAANPYQECENVISNGENVIPNGENVILVGENVIPVGENVIRVGENVAHNENNVIYNCKKCNKEYNSKRYLKEHERTCKGIDNLTCSRCMKTFTSRTNKSRHCKKNNCKPVSIFEADNVKSIINLQAKLGEADNTFIQYLHDTEAQLYKKLEEKNETEYRSVSRS